MSERERWGSRIGLILAMAGNAVGLGNFLRFPVQAAENGGGAFMIPYFIAFLLLGIPLMWVEWALGRHGGKYNHGSLPGMFDSMWNNPMAKYLGVVGLFASTVIMIYYTYIESWTLGFSFFSISQMYFGIDNFEQMTGFLKSYQGVGEGYFSNGWLSYFILLITLALNFWILRKGLSKGIEILAKIGMPLLFLFGALLAVRVLTLGTPDPNFPERNIVNGLAFIWNPDFSALSDSKVWLASAGQIFFTLSIGMGTLQAYASYLKPKDDIILSGLATSSLNEFAEVVLGGAIAIPVAIAFFGTDLTKEIAAGGSFNLGFVSMPLIFQKLPFGSIMGFLWFFLLFIAGITSSVAMAQPLISFLKEQFDWSHKKATNAIGLLIFVSVHLVVLYFEHGFLDEMDYWGGTFALIVIATLEVVIFAWIWGMDKGWKELNSGADIKTPKIFYYIIKYVTPLYLFFILSFWTYQQAIPTLLMEGANPESVPYMWLARIFLVLLFVGLTVLVYFAWKRNGHKYKYDN